MAEGVEDNGRPGRREEIRSTRVLGLRPDEEEVAAHEMALGSRRRPEDDALLSAPGTRRGQMGQNDAADRATAGGCQRLLHGQDNARWAGHI